MLQSSRNWFNHCSMRYHSSYTQMIDCPKDVTCINTFSDMPFPSGLELLLAEDKKSSIVIDNAEKTKTHRKNNPWLAHFHYLPRSPWLKTSSASWIISAHIQAPRPASSSFDVFSRIVLVFIPFASKHPIFSPLLFHTCII